MVKQIALEAYYRRKIDKSMVIKDIVAVLFLLFGVCVIPSPMLVCMILILSMNFTQWKNQKTRFAEGMSFAPLSLKEIKEWVLLKCNLYAFCSMLLLWISCGVVLLNVKKGNSDLGYELHAQSMEYMLYLGVAVFSYIRYMTLSSEIARMRGVRNVGITQWVYSLKYCLIFAAFFILFFALFFWLGIRIISDFENYFVPAIERSIILIALVGEYITGICLEQSVLKEFIYSDYNVRITRDEEVDYEY